ncbi:hypothetical protein C8Q73DRAFT_92129 [Cubamyces lactineus]|nr:hypothetical protein C8Q73DRAFT_92129 [Cubamyces lactineus]
MGKWCSVTSDGPHGRLEAVWGPPEDSSQDTVAFAAAGTVRVPRYLYRIPAALVRDTFSRAFVTARGALFILSAVRDSNGHRRVQALSAESRSSISMMRLLPHRHTAALLLLHTAPPATLSAPSLRVACPHATNSFALFLPSAPGASLLVLGYDITASMGRAKPIHALVCGYAGFKMGHIPCLPPTGPAPGHGRGLALQRPVWPRLWRSIYIHHTCHQIALPTRIPESDTMQGYVPLSVP